MTEDSRFEQIRRILYRLPCNCPYGELEFMGAPVQQHADGCNYWLVKEILEIIGEPSDRHSQTE